MQTYTDNLTVETLKHTKHAKRGAIKIQSKNTIYTLENLPKCDQNEFFYYQNILVHYFTKTDFIKICHSRN